MEVIFCSECVSRVLARNWCWWRINIESLRTVQRPIRIYLSGDFDKHIDSTRHYENKEYLVLWIALNEPRCWQCVFQDTHCICSVTSFFISQIQINKLYNRGKGWLAWVLASLLRCSYSWTPSGDALKDPALSLLPVRGDNSLGLLHLPTFPFS